MRSRVPMGQTVPGLSPGQYLDVRPRLRRADQRYAGAGGGPAEVVIECGERQTFANCQFEVGGIIGRANGRICWASQVAGRCSIGIGSSLRRSRNAAWGGAFISPPRSARVKKLG